MSGIERFLSANNVGHAQPCRVRERFGSAAGTATRPCCRQTRISTLEDEVGLELSEGSKDVEDGLPAWRGGVDVLGQALEANAAPVQVGQRVDEVPQRPAQAVEPPDDNGVTFPELLQGRGQTGTVRFGTRGRIGAGMRTAGLFQRVELQVKGLFRNQAPK
jgi:hypothetical protein